MCANSNVCSTPGLEPNKATKTTLLDFCERDPPMTPVNSIRVSWSLQDLECHCNDVIMRAIVSQITGVSIVNSTVCLGADPGKHQSSVSLVFVGVIDRWPVNSPHKGPVTRKTFPFDDVIMCCGLLLWDLPVYRYHVYLAQWSQLLS